MFIFSPRSPFPFLNRAVITLLRRLPPDRSPGPVPLLLQIAGEVTVAVFNVGNALHQHLVPQSDLRRHLSHHLSHQNPPIRLVLSQEHQDFFENLILLDNVLQLSDQKFVIVKENGVLERDLSKFSWNPNAKI